MTDLVEHHDFPQNDPSRHLCRMCGRPLIQHGIGAAHPYAGPFPNRLHFATELRAPRNPAHDTGNPPTSDDVERAAEQSERMRREQDDRYERLRQEMRKMERKMEES